MSLFILEATCSPPPGVLGSLPPLLATRLKAVNSQPRHHWKPSLCSTLQGTFFSFFIT